MTAKQLKTAIANNLIYMKKITLYFCLIIISIGCNKNLESKTYLTIKTNALYINKESNNFDTLNLITGKINYKNLKQFNWITDTKFVSKPMFIDVESFDQFKKMQTEAKKVGVNLKIISGVRSFEDQKSIWERKWLDRNHIKDEKDRALDILKYSSMPMTSRHHWGTDIDINSLNNKYFSQGEGLKVYNWLNENANQYGFHQVYTNKKNANRTGYEEEKWHWSYLPKAKKYLDFYNKNLRNTEIKGFLGSDQAQQVDMLKNYVNGVSTN
jgi:LAS superfamily LD-carboxypeptidase LdcB